MSLRTDLHAAFGEIEPSTFGLPERVVETVQVHGPAGRRRERMVLRMRAPLALVAVLVVIALVVGALVGGRLLQDWNAEHRPAPAGGPSQADQIAALEARPWHDALLPASAVCPNGPRDSQGVYGAGPFRGDPSLSPGSTTTRWGFYFDLVGATDKGTAGLLLIRARDLRTGTVLVFVGPHAIGPAVGTDTLRGQLVQQHSELLLDTDHRPTGLGSTGPSGQTYWPFTVGAIGAWPQCVGWQIDGTGSTETFSFKFP